MRGHGKQHRNFKPAKEWVQQGGSLKEGRRSGEGGFQGGEGPDNRLSGGGLFN
jgi:hypothetical protein